jgi:hypothetical protein
MNPVNLKLEGLYAATAALMHALRDKRALSSAEIESALAAAEHKSRPILRAQPTF